MLNVLINAYAVSPTWGSEPGVGWNWVINLAKYCNVHVITESEWQKEIEDAWSTLSQRNNLHFYFNPVPEKVRRICWNQGDWRFYWYYRKWQKKTLAIAQEIIRNNKIDIIHHLNMIGFREPGYLWKIKDIPYIWGPIGGIATIPMEYLDGNPLKDRLKQRIKNLISHYQARNGRVSKAIRRSNKLITVAQRSADIIRKVYGKDNIEVLPETGLNISKETPHGISENEKIKLLWVGRFIPTKKLDFALHIISRLKEKDKYELHIVGWGDNKSEERYRKMAVDLGVDHLCKWFGKIPNQEVQHLMKDSDILLFTSVLEGTPHVVLEALSNNLPVICFDLCGQGVIINDEVGWKVPVSTLPMALERMIKIIDDLQKNKKSIYLKSHNCENRKPELSWDFKIKTVLGIYNQLANCRK